jgi:O-methyltransferase involved in polyketide biosynthesis
MHHTPPKRFALEGVNKTLLLPLWARTKESTQKNPLIMDGQAERILKALDYNFSEMDKSLDRYYQLSQVVRAVMTDNEIRTFINIHPDATVVNIGAGLDTTFERIDNGSIHWYDLDVPDVIELRRQFIAETERSRYIPKSVFDLSWFDDISSPIHGLLFIACGVFQYFTGRQVKRLFSDLATRFPGGEIVFDTMSKFFLILGNWIVIKKSGMDRRSFMKWGAKSSKEMTRWDRRFTVVDEYPLFSRIHLDGSWGKDIIHRMKQANRMRGLNIFHLRFELEC